VPFRAVWERSFCRAMEVLVPVSAERPRDVEHLFKPPCVRLLRCAGCCGDERLQCLPTRTHNTTMQILKVKPLHGQYLEEMTFVQHSACECSSLWREETTLAHNTRCSYAVQKR
uniref:Platelet-derived growth factor (PDGF) family profile domain-containing protein n=1 Tax=Petromyzon marinus TaxID=7757 RepID=S4RT82_PETMA